MSSGSGHTPAASFGFHILQLTGQSSWAREAAISSGLELDGDAKPLAASCRRVVSCSSKEQCVRRSPPRPPVWFPDSRGELVVSGVGQLVSMKADKVGSHALAQARPLSTSCNVWSRRMLDSLRRDFVCQRCPKWASIVEAAMRPPSTSSSLRGSEHVMWDGHSLAGRIVLLTPKERLLRVAPTRASSRSRRQSILSISGACIADHVPGVASVSPAERENTLQTTVF